MKLDEYKLRKRREKLLQELCMLGAEKDEDVRDSGGEVLDPTQTDFKGVMMGNQNGIPYRPAKYDGSPPPQSEAVVKQDSTFIQLKKKKKEIPPEDEKVKETPPEKEEEKEKSSEKGEVEEIPPEKKEQVSLKKDDEKEKTIQAPIIVQTVTPIPSSSRIRNSFFARTLRPPVTSHLVLGISSAVQETIHQTPVVSCPPEVERTTLLTLAPESTKAEDTRIPESPMIIIQDHPPLSISPTKADSALIEVIPKEVENIPVLAETISKITIQNMPPSTTAPEYSSKELVQPNNSRNTFFSRTKRTSVTPTNYFLTSVPLNPPVSTSQAPIIDVAYPADDLRSSSATSSSDSTIIKIEENSVSISPPQIVPLQRSGFKRLKPNDTEAVNVLPNAVELIPEVITIADSNPSSSAVLKKANSFTSRFAVSKAYTVSE